MRGLRHRGVYVVCFEFLHKGEIGTAPTCWLQGDIGFESALKPSESKPARASITDGGTTTVSVHWWLCFAEMGDSETRERRVRFHGRVQFKTIRHVADFSDEEIQEGWYRKKDFMRMSEEVSEIAQLVAQGKESHNGEELSIRGLEHLVEEDVADYRAEKMIASIDAVLDEQDEQRDEDVNDPEVIAKIYTEIVAPLQREAYLVGLRDAKEAAMAAESIPDMAPLTPPAEVPTPMDIDPPVEKQKKKKDPLAPKKKLSSGKIKKLPVIPPAPPAPVARKKSPKILAAKHIPATSSNDEGEEMLNMGDEKDDKKNDTKPKPMSAEQRKAAQEKRKNRVRGTGSEVSPLVRRRDGSFAFRNRELDHAKAELKKQRRDCVRDALFKHLDSPDPMSNLGIR